MAIEKANEFAARLSNFALEGQFTKIIAAVVERDKAVIQDYEQRVQREQSQAEQVLLEIHSLLEHGRR